MFLLSADSNSDEHTATIIGSVITIVIVIIVVTAILTVLYLVKKKHRLVKEMRVLETQNSEACFRYVCSFLFIVLLHNYCTDYTICFAVDIIYRYVPTPNSKFGSVSQCSINTEGV